MSRIRFAVLAIVLTLLLLPSSTGPLQAGSPGAVRRFQLCTLIEDFHHDPTTRLFRRFGVQGPGAAQFVHEDSAPRFRGDWSGSLAVTYDSLAPTSRYYARFPMGFTQDDDFVFGAILTIRSEGFAPDPSGFHPIAFSLFNASTTGDDRTGDLSNFASDTFDTVEFSYFPNVSPFFGGPFLSPDVFGSAVGADAFLSFAFASVPLALAPGNTYLVEMEHDAVARTLTTTLHRLHPHGGAIPVEGGAVVVDVSSIDAFSVDSIGISAYHDGFNVFSESGRSLLATVDYDLLYSAPRIDGRLPLRLSSILSQLKKTPLVIPHHGHED